MIRFLLFTLTVTLCFAQQSLARETPVSAMHMQLSFAPVVKQAAPAVVNIYTKRRVQVRSPLANFYNDPVFRRFFGNHPQANLTQERVVQSLGSGVIVHPSGIIVSSSHVVEQSDEIIAVLSDKREYPAKIVALDQKTDLAILMVDLKKTEKLPYLRLASSQSLEVGDLVLAIGNPFGVGQTVTSGIVSAITVPTGKLAKKIPSSQAFIQTDAAINPGNSGGALVDMRGRLVGINAAIFSQSGGSQGIGFAIPAEVLNEMLKQFSL